MPRPVRRTGQSVVSGRRVSNVVATVALSANGAIGRVARVAHWAALANCWIGAHYQTNEPDSDIFFRQKFVRVFEAGVGSRVFFEGQLSCFKLIQIFEISSYKVWKTVLVD